MKSLRLFVALAPFALAIPLSAHAAMSQEARNSYMEQCLAAAGQNLSAADAKTHCTCGEKQINENFSQKEIDSLNDPTTPQSTALTTKLQKLVSDNCPTSKK